MEEGRSIILYETPSFVVVNKPSGILTHHVKNQEPGVSALTDLLVAWYPETQSVGDSPVDRPGIVHRLDKDTSGVLIVPRTQEAYEYFKAEFKSHRIQKTYLALVHGTPPLVGNITTPIGLIPGTVRRSTMGKHMKMVKEARTDYSVLETFTKDGELFSLIELTPKTGRTHQLRVHLNSSGFQIVGDQLYGKKKNPWSLSRQFLHAQFIVFTTSDGKKLRIEADLPDDLQKILKDLKSEK